MKPVRIMLAAFALLWTISGGAAFAAEYRKFDRADFEKAQADGRPILVDVAAWWCPTCSAQKSAIKAATAGKAFDRMIVYRLDYDGQKKDWRRLKVRQQSTLIAFKGSRETGRSVGDTDSNRILTLLNTTSQQ